MNCPRDLQLLADVDLLFVCQKTELFEVFTGFEMPNRYEILDGVGNTLMYAGEDTDTLAL